jgi:hypothetical protein
VVGQPGRRRLPNRLARNPNHSESLSPTYRRTSWPTEGAFYCHPPSRWRTGTQCPFNCSFCSFSLAFSSFVYSIWRNIDASTLADTVSAIPYPSLLTGGSASSAQRSHPVRAWGSTQRLPRFISLPSHHPTRSFSLCVLFSNLGPHFVAINSSNDLAAVCIQTYEPLVDARCAAGRCCPRL